MSSVAYDSESERNEAKRGLRLIEGGHVDKTKALEAALAHIEKQFGKGSIMKLGQNASSMDVEAISTGSLGLDIALGIGGSAERAASSRFSARNRLARRHCPCIVLPKPRKWVAPARSSMRSTPSTRSMRASSASIWTSLLISQPDTGEQALEIADTLVRSGAVDVLVIDSVAALTPKAELEGEMGDSLPGLQARLMSQALRKLTGSISKSKCMVIFINQIRMKIGVMFGNPETTTGGNALKFYASVRLDIRRIGQIKNGDDVVGNQTRVKVVKNKVAPPFKQVEFDITYGEGISKVGELIDLGSKAGVIEKSGAWFSFKGERIGQGRENAKLFMKQNPKIAAEVESAIRSNAGLGEKLLAQPEGDEAKDADEGPDADGVLPDAEDGCQPSAPARDGAEASAFGQTLVSFEQLPASLGHVYRQRVMSHLPSFMGPSRHGAGVRERPTDRVHGEARGVSV